MSCTTRTTVILATIASGAIIGLGVLARVSPEFKAAATDISLTLLVVLLVAGLLGALIAPLLDHWTDTDPSVRDDRPDQPSPTPRVGSTR